ncbi:hypothetical protein AGMMS49965_26110 [Bacteroidia bacterium]|nr:hypothetical protein AGMMS49965_26110 [Bacteroidia bacterium]
MWLQGYWEIAPYANAYWIPGYWQAYQSGYRWIDAHWLPRSQYFSFGYYDGRYDYYGRPVYYHRPHSDHYYGYAYAYDHHPEHRVAVVVPRPIAINPHIVGRRSHNNRFMHTKHNVRSNRNLPIYRHIRLRLSIRRHLNAGNNEQ